MLILISGVAAVATACSFSGPATVAPHDAALADGVQDSAAIDAPALRYWLVVASDAGPMTTLDVLPFDSNGFIGSCARTPIPKRANVLAAHPALPYVYAAGLGLEGIAVGCGQATPTTLTDIGNFRANQTITLGPTVGFLTVDGPGSNGTYRFTIAADGTPTVTGGTASPSGTGPAVEDAAAGELYVAGNVIFKWPLPAPDQQFGSPVAAATCGAPTDLLLSGGALLAFCADSGDVQRYTRTPFARVGTVGAIGAMDRVVPLPGDRAIGARIAPSRLVAITLGGGMPTWLDGPALPSRATALTTSADGAVVATTRSIDAATSEVAIWRIVDSSITQIATKTLVGTATAAAIVHPGT